MALATYTDLQASIQSWLFARPTMATLAPDFIRLAEAYMDGVIRHRLMTTSTTFTFTGELTPLPADFRGVKTLANSVNVIDYIDADAMAAERIANQGSAVSKYTVQGSNLQAWPAPANGSTANLVYLAAIPSLASNATNWLLTRWPNAYLYGSLLQAAPFLGEDERIPVWQTLFETALANIATSNLVEQAGALTVRGGLVI